MDKALVSGAKDCGFESHLGCKLSFFWKAPAHTNLDHRPRLKVVIPLLAPSS